MEKEQRLEAKQHLVVLMHQGISWKEARATVGVHISRSTAYRWVQGMQSRGEAALLDGRHGHPTKLRQAVLQWLVATCRAKPHTKDETEGLVKLLVDKEGQILGGHVLASGGGELLAPIVVAMHAGLPAIALASTMLPYPTMSEAIRQAADRL